MIKICTKCGHSKDITEFDIRNTLTGTHQSWCKRCKSSYSRNRYLNGPRKQQSMESNRLQRLRIRQYINTIKLENGCSKCGYNVCAHAIDFHHINKKDNNIGTLVQSMSSIKKIKQEISKCIILCCRCHRELHSGVEDKVVESPASQVGH